MHHGFYRRPGRFVYDPVSHDLYAVTTATGGCGLIDEINSADSVAGDFTLNNAGESSDAGGWSNLGVYDPQTATYIS